ncbi:MAG: DUF4838 domain-containing protein [Armatimonadota bacterium]
MRERNRVRILLAFFAMVFMSASASQAKVGTLPIARGGKALVQIAVNSTAAIPAENTAASELAVYLEKMTGATFAVVEEGALPGGTAAIYVGDTKRARVAGIDPGKLGREESILRSVDNGLLLAGGRKRGTLYAVYELLEQTLGVRWYTPWAEKVPQRATLTLPALNKHMAPPFIFRDNYNHLGDPRMYPDTAGWMRYLSRNRMLISSRAPKIIDAFGVQPIFGGRVSGHGFAPYLPADKYFKEHPEYFSLRDGKRVPSNGLDGNHACLSNPDVLRIITAAVKEDIARQPDALAFKVSVNDGGSKTICDCPECRKIAAQYGATEEPRTDTGLLAWFVNQVADAIKTAYPDKYIWTIIYGPASELPKNIRFRDNVIIQVCTDLSPEWAKYAKNIWVWQYTNHTRRGNYLNPWLWWVDDRMKLYQRLGTVSGVFQENEFLPGGDCLFYQFYEMNLWIFSQQCRNPGRNVDALANEFIDFYYGSAAPALQTYVKLYKARRGYYPFALCNYAFVDRAQKLFDQAEAAVKNSPEGLARVKDLRLPLDITCLTLRNQIITDYLQRPGSSLVKYPYSRSVLRERALATIRATKHPFLQNVSPVYVMDAKGNAKATFPKVLPRLEGLVNELCQGKEYVPLPEQFRGLPMGSVFDFTTMALGLKPYSASATSHDAVQTDPEAADGTAYVRFGAEELPLPIGIWNNAGVTDPVFAQSQRDFLKLDQSGQYVDWPEICRTIKAADITGPGYHLYKGPHFQLRPATLSYATKWWTYGQSIASLYRESSPREMWDVYLSAKFTGPAYPHGNVDDKNAVYLDRVIFVRTGERATR